MRLFLAVLTLLLAVCGTDAQTRMVTGAGIGAMGGALVGGRTTPQPYYSRSP